MSHDFSADLRRRVIATISDGVSTPNSAKRFGIGISTAGEWCLRADSGSSQHRVGDSQCRKGRMAVEILTSKGNKSAPTPRLSGTRHKQYRALTFD